MTPRGVGRILMIAIILLGPGISQLFHVDYAAARPINQPAAVQAKPESAPAEVAQAKPESVPALAPKAQAPGAPSVTCKSSTDFANNFVGVAGFVFEVGSGAIGNAKVEVIQSNAAGAELSVLASTFTTFQPFDNVPTGYFAFDQVFDLSSGTLSNIIVKVSRNDYLTEYYDRRYDSVTAVKLNIDKDASGNCLVTETNPPGGGIVARLGTAGGSQAQISLYNQGGIAGRVTLAQAPNSLYTGTPAPIIDSVPITDATIQVLTRTIISGNPVTGTTVVQQTTTDAASDGYYRLGKLGAIDPNTGQPQEYVVRFFNNRYNPTIAEGYSWWRDGNLPPPYSAFPSTYFTYTIPITAGTINQIHQYITVTNNNYRDPNTGQFIKGINGHLVVPATISGTVLDNSSGTPTAVPGAKVQLYDSTGTTLLQTVNSVDGTYKFINLSPGVSFRIKALPPSGAALVARWYPSKDAPGDPVNIPIPSSNQTSINVSNIDITLVPGAKFTGTITESGTGVGLGGVIAQVFKASDPPATAIPVVESAPSSQFGVYTIPAVLDVGVAYRLGFRPDPNHIPAYCQNFTSNPCPTVASLANSGSYTFSSISEVKSVDVQLVKGLSISGSISATSNGTPVSDLAAKGLKVQVYVYDNTGTNLFQTFLVTPGNSSSVAYQTSGLAQGNYKLQFVAQSDPANTGFVPAYYSASSQTGSSTIGGATSITVGDPFVPDPPVTGINIQLVEGVQISLNLQAINPFAPPPTVIGANIYVELYAKSDLNNDGQRVGFGTTDSNGDITFSAVPYLTPSAYALKVIPSSTYATTWVTDTAGPPGVTKTSYVLTPGTPKAVSFILPLGGGITGAIYDPNDPNFDFSSTVISVYDGTKKFLYTFNNPPSTQTVFFANGKWQYQLYLLPGTYYLGFGPPAGSVYYPLFYQKSSVLNTNNPNLQVLSVQAGNANKLTGIDAVFIPKGKFQVKVVDAANNPLAGATVRFYYGNPNSDGQGDTQLPAPDDQGTTDASGTFLSNALPAGTSYEFKISANGVFYNSSVGNQITNIQNALNVDLNGFKGGIEPITIVITAKYQASGVVQVSNSAGVGPLQGVTVEAIDPVGGTVVGTSTTTNASGAYLVQNISGSYKLRFTYRFGGNGIANSVIYWTNTSPYGTANVSNGGVFTTNSTSDDITFLRNGSYIGIISCQNGNSVTPLPPPGATITLLDATDQTKVFATTTTDASGNYTLQDQEAGYGNYFKILVSPQACGVPVYYTQANPNGVLNFSNAGKISLAFNGRQTASLTLINGANNNCYIAQAVPTNIDTSSVTLQVVANCQGNNLTFQVYQGTAPGQEGATPVTTIQAGSSSTQNIVISNLQPDTNYYFKVSITNPPNNANEIFFPTELLARTAASGKNWYFPFGDSRNNGTVTNVEFLHILNYNNSDATVSISYFTNSGAAVVRNNITVKANSRFDVEVSNPSDVNGLNNSIAAGALHATQVTSSQPIMVERSVYNTTNGGLNNGGATSGGTVLPGSPSINQEWYFADGTLDSNTDTDYWIFNPDNQSSLCVVAALYPNANNGGSAQNTKFYPTLFNIAANNYLSISSRTLGTALGSPNAGFGVGFASCNGSQLFVAEQRILYNNNPTTNPGDLYRKGEANLFGALGPGSQWFFMEGLTDKITSRFYALMNITSTAATVNITIYLDNPGNQTNPLTLPAIVVPANGRVIVPISDYNVKSLGRTYGFTVKITSDQAIVVQRTLQFTWRQLPIADGMFSQLAINRVATTWLFTAGSTFNDSVKNKVSDMAINVYNPGDSQVNLRVTYYYSSNTTTNQTDKTVSFSNYLLNPKSRLSIQPITRPTAGYPSIGTGYKLVAVKVEALDGGGNNLFTDNPIFAERMMYWTYGAGLNGGNAVYGYNPPGT